MLGNIERMLAYSKQKKQNDRDFMFCFEDLVEFELDEAKKVKWHPSSSEVSAYGVNIKEGFIARNQMVVNAMPEDTHLVGTVIKVKQMVTKKDGSDMASIEIYSPKGIMQMMVFPKEWRTIRAVISADETYIFKYKVNPPRGDFDESFQILAAKPTTNFSPKSLVLTDAIGYNESVAKSLPTLPSGPVEVIYEGDDVASFRSDTIGYLNVVTQELLKSLPSRVEYQIHAF